MRARASFPVLALFVVGRGAMATDVPHPRPGTGDAAQKVSEMKIQIQLEGRSVTATLEESQAAQEFLSLLPLSLTLTDYNSTEKVADLPRKLSTKGAPAGVDPDIGDIAYYAPWGNLAIFYRDFGYSSGLVKLGGLDSGGCSRPRRSPPAPSFGSSSRTVDRLAFTDRERETDRESRRGGGGAGVFVRRAGAGAPTSQL